MSLIMEAFARAPDPLTKDGDLATNWKSWKEDFIIFLKLTGYINKPSDDRANLLKNRIGKIGIDAIQNIPFDDEKEKDDMDILIVKLEEYFNPPKNEVVERYQFFTTCKKPNESIEEHINVLKEKAKTCNFNDMTDSFIRDKIVRDTNDKMLRKKFFDVKNLDLKKLIEIYHDYNINIEKMRQITESSKEKQIPKANKEKPATKDNKEKQATKDNKEKQATKDNKEKQATKNNKEKPDNKDNKEKQVPKNSKKNQATKDSKEKKEYTTNNFPSPPQFPNPKKNCWRCDQQHPIGKCPAWGSKCTKCNDINHFSHCCKGFKTNADEVINCHLKVK
ncbi:hypothetical protein PUN28_009147 [Cardiocondyla obscurior]|uniref:Gag protein n=2 Tax=Cardiocondyla obscurior TaxID=286306 RepID=A0AAW2FQQ8_9HYME